MVTTQTADNVLKSYYLDAVAEQLNNNINPLLARIASTSSDVWGRDVRKAVRVGVNGGIGAGTESGNLPTAGDGEFVQFVSTLKNLYGTIEISDKAIRAAASNDGAFVNLLNYEMDSLVKSASYNFGRMLFGDGSGYLCKIWGSNTTTFHADTTQNVTEGMLVDIFAPSATVGLARKVLAVDRDENTITISGGTFSCSESDGIKVYVQGSRDLEITGLGAIFDANKLYGVTRSSNSWLNPYKQTEVGAITELAIQKAIDTVDERTGSKIDFIVTSPGVKRALASVLSSYRHLDSMELEGGFRAISFNGIPVVADRFCPKGTMYLLNTKDFGLHQLCDWQWLEGEDGKILKQVAGRPVYTATLVKYADLMCYRPAGQARLSGITES